MVDDSKTYNGSFAGVFVANNVIIGQRLFFVGVAIGSCVWLACDLSSLKGPSTITNNSFIGNITFPIAINGWIDGLTVMLRAEI
jgi:hypothetical protein